MNKVCRNESLEVRMNKVCRNESLEVWMNKCGGMNDWEGQMN
jgi:hypothetical protein